MVLDQKEAAQSFEWMQRGSDFHLIFNMFFDKVDLHKVVELATKIKVLDEPDKTELHTYITELMWSFVDKDAVMGDTYSHLYDLNLYGFATFQVQCIIEIMRVNGYISMAMLKRWWMPKGLEEFMKDEENKLYGTLDAWYEHFDGSVFALDYKTGKKKYVKNDDEDNPKKPRINFPANMQGWVYTWLLHKVKGYPLKGMKFVLLHTKGNPQPVVMRITKASIDGLFNRVKEIRTYVKEVGEYPMPEPDSQSYVCPFCQFQKECHPADVLERYAKIRKEEWLE
jgi:CRISPR/Cas system-associated exonuclease Cas4 (RecB family)